MEQAKRGPLHRCYSEGRLAVLFADASQLLKQDNNWEAGWCDQQVLPKAKASMSACTASRRVQGYLPGLRSSARKDSVLETGKALTCRASTTSSPWSER